MKVVRSAVALLAFALGAGAIASAADPSPAPNPPPAANALPIPPGAANNPYVKSILDAVLGGVLQTTNGNSAHGRVTYFRRFDLQLETAPGVYRTVHLHQGTEIDPRGLTLAPGMLVDVRGAAQSDGSLNADAIVKR